MTLADAAVEQNRRSLLRPYRELLRHPNGRVRLPDRWPPLLAYLRGLRRGQWEGRSVSRIRNAVFSVCVLVCPRCRGYEVNRVQKEQQNVSVVMLLYCTLKTSKMLFASGPRQDMRGVERTISYPDHSFVTVFIVSLRAEIETRHRDALRSPFIQPRVQTR